MQVYKLFFKILRNQLGQIIMYIGIFAAISIIISSQKANEADFSFKESKQKFSIFDYDNSKASEALTAYLTDSNTLVEIADDKTETLQDELYNRNITNAIIIPTGFENAVLEGNATEFLEIYNLPGLMQSSAFEQQVNSYMKMLNIYVSAGVGIDDAIKNVETSLNTQTKVTVQKKTNTANSPEYYFFSYLAYIFISVAVVALAPILIVVNKDNIRGRIACSSYKLSKINLELILGIITLGTVICLIFTIMSFAVIGEFMFSLKGFLYLLNMAIYMTISLGIAYFAGQIAKNEEGTSMIANIAGLGCSFLGGVFVPLDMLGDGVIKVAHFLPSYWYVLGDTFIRDYQSGQNLTALFEYMGIELIFAVIFFTAGAVVVKIKRG